MTLLADIGDRVTLTATFTDSAGDAVAPTAVTLKVLDPSGNTTTTTSGFTNDSTGVYSYDVDIDEAGVWHYNFAGTGNAVAADEGEFRVSESVFA